MNNRRGFLGQLAATLVAAKVVDPKNVPVEVPMPAPVNIPLEGAIMYSGEIVHVNHKGQWLKIVNPKVRAELISEE